MLLCMAGWTACATPQPAQDVIILGLGELSPETLQALTAPDPDLPHVHRLAQEGATGALSVEIAGISTAGRWTTVATGQTMEEHGVGIHTDRPATSHGLRVPALWHRVSAADQRVAVIGWPGTWPVDDVAGRMISQHAFLQTQATQDATRAWLVGAGLPRTVHPAALETTLREQIAGRPPTEDPYFAATRLSRPAAPSSQRPDLLMLYRPAPSAEQVDRLLGTLLETADATTRLMVIALPPSGTPKGGHVVLWGPGIRSRATLPNARLDGIAPTVLTWLGISIPADLPGRVFERAFAAPPPITHVAGHDPALDEGSAMGATAAAEALPRVGFLRGFPRFAPDDPRALKDVAHLARLSGRAGQAEAMYRRLLETSPDDAVLHRSLGAALGAQERYDEALDHIEHALSLDSLQPAAYLHRARLSEITGNNPQAYVDYKTALLLDPALDGAAQGLERLGASPHLYPTRNAEDKEAARLIGRALEAARNQDYDHALEILEQAEDASPPYVLTYVVRANVHYLKGKIQEAITALELAAAVEPDNALFAQNLRRLRAEPPRKPPKGQG